MLSGVGSPSPMHSQRLGQPTTVCQGAEWIQFACPGISRLCSWTGGHVEGEGLKNCRSLGCSKQVCQPLLAWPCRLTRRQLQLALRTSLATGSPIHPKQRQPRRASLQLV